MQACSRAAPPKGFWRGGCRTRLFPPFSQPPPRRRQQPQSPYTRPHTQTHTYTQKIAVAQRHAVSVALETETTTLYSQSVLPARRPACMRAGVLGQLLSFPFFFFRSCEVEKLGALGGVWWTHDLNMEARPAWSPSPRGSFPPLSPLPAAATLPADRVPLNKLPRGAQPSPTVCDGRTRRDLFCMRWTSRRRHAPWT